MMNALIFTLFLYLVSPVLLTEDISETAEEMGTVFMGRIVYTKWCGPGNDAASYHDLGENIDIDKCCRHHDVHCHLSVGSGKTRFGFTNNGPYKVSGCSCDAQLFNCLRDVKSWVTNLVASVFAYSRQKCLIDFCTLPNVRCSREGDIRAAVLDSFVFIDVEKADNTETVNESIKNWMESEQSKKRSKSTENENQNTEPYQWQRQEQNNHYQVSFQPHAQPNQYNPWQSDISNQNYLVLYPWQNQRVANSPIESFDFNQNLPTQQGTDLICCADELQQL